MGSVVRRRGRRGVGGGARWGAAALALHPQRANLQCTSAKRGQTGEARRGSTVCTAGCVRAVGRSVGEEGRTGGQHSPQIRVSQRVPRRRRAWGAIEAERSTEGNGKQGDGLLATYAHACVGVLLLICPVCASLRARGTTEVAFVRRFGPVAQLGNTICWTLFLASLPVSFTLPHHFAQHVLRILLLRRGVQCISHLGR
jgi:hypothetical protein